MTGETNIDRLIASMDPGLRPGIYVFATLPAGAPLPEGLNPVMQFREDEGTTLILERDEAAQAGLASVYPSRMITLRIHSSLAGIGFLARVTGHLARAGISVNPVSAYFHDHLFVTADRAEEAVALLRALAAGA